MSTASRWSTDDLKRIAESDDLHIVPFRDDGVTYGTPTWIWSVVVDGYLYVRAYNGKDSRWHQAALRQPVAAPISRRWSARAHEPRRSR